MRILRQARIEDLSEVERIQHTIKVSGVDRQGSPILVIVAEYIHRIRADPEKVFLFVTNLRFDFDFFSGNQIYH